MTARECVLSFCNAWFKYRNIEQMAEFFADDVDFIGVGEDEYVHGKLELVRYLMRDIGEMPDSLQYSITFIHEQQAAEQVTTFAAGLFQRNSLYTWRRNVSVVLVSDTGGIWKISSFHIAETGISKPGAGHYPQTPVMKNALRQRQELLNEALSGGMMGGYFEDRFPFYFINRRMLDYLGYRDEEEFVEDIDGFISNCMHPDDQLSLI